MELNDALNLDVDSLLVELGEQYIKNSKGIFPVNPKEIYDHGKIMMNIYSLMLQDSICNNSYIFKHIGEQSDEKIIALELLNIIIAAKIGFSPAIITAILVKKGLKIYCHNHWKNNSWN